MSDMTYAAEKLVDWQTAVKVGSRVAGRGTPLTSIDRARLQEDFAEVVPEADTLVQSLTGMTPKGYRARPWVMNRQDWIKANVRGFEQILEPFAKRVLEHRTEGSLASVRRSLLGAQLGGLLGYVGHRVLGQYDVFLPPDDEGLIYFVGPNIAGLERKFGFPAREFRLWVSLHEVAHRVQFGAVPWLRDHVAGMVEEYLGSVEMDPKWLMDGVRRAVEELRAGKAEWRGLGWVFLLMTPSQRDIVRRLQAVMALLEGHGNFAMNEASKGRVEHADMFQRRLHERRNRRGVEAAFHKAIGFDVKVRQYDIGQRFVSVVVDRVGIDGFNRVWESPANLPTLEEMGEPLSWVERVGAA